MERRIDLVYNFPYEAPSIQAKDEVAELQKQLASYERDKVSLAVS